MKKYGYISCLCLVLSLWNCQISAENDASQSKDTIANKQLLSIEQVRQQLESQKPPIIIEVSKKTTYEQGHLPNAIHMWRPDYEDQDNEYGGMIASKTAMENLLSTKGIHPQSNIILYDSKGSCDAIRLLWILNLYGHQKVSFMNGGKVAWQQANYSLTKEIPHFAPTNYTFSEADNFEQYARLEEVQNAIQDTNVILLDTRESAEYLGQAYAHKGQVYAYKKGAYTYGCIPTAVHLNWSDAVDLKGDHRFKSIKDLKYNFEKIGVTPDKKIIAYCQSGVRSMHTTYVLSEILGYPNVKNYDGSWIEWSYYHMKDSSLAIQQYTDATTHQEMLKRLAHQ